MHEKESIVQHYDLKPAEDVENPEGIPVSTLSKWWEEASRICKKNGFGALAFNQLSRRTLDRMGFGGGNPNIIFFGKNPDKRDWVSEVLLINPNLETSYILGQSVSVEGCGSITDSNGVNPRMFISRPTYVNIETFAWSPGYTKPIGKKFVPGAVSSYLIQHEHKHLKGETALTEGDNVLDFRDKSIMKWLTEEIFNPKIYDIPKIISNYSKWLVYDESEKVMKFVTPDGRQIDNEF
jgi:hypothetical protein